MFRFKLVFLGIFVAAAVVATVYWNEARKEVVYLCGNFASGVSRSSVLKQLDTGHFLRYRLELHPGGSRIEADSWLNFGIYRCIIEFDGNDKVVNAVIE